MIEKILLLLLTLQLIFISFSVNATDAKVTFMLDPKFDLRVDAKIYNNDKGIIIQYYRSDGTGDILQVSVPAFKIQANLFRLNPRSYYIFEAYEEGVKVASQELITGHSCSQQFEDDEFITVSGDPTFDILVTEIQIQYKVFAFDKYGKVVWCCYDCGPVSELVDMGDEDNEWVVQDKQSLVDADRLGLDDDLTMDTEDHGNLKRMTMSGEIISILNTSQYDFTHEITSDPYNKDIVYTLGDGRNVHGVESDAVIKADFKDGSYDKIIDFGRWFYPNDGDWSKISSGTNWMHSNSVFISEFDGSFICSMNQINAVASFDYETRELNWVISAEIPSDWEFDRKMGHFWKQHDANQLPNGNLLMFDNGNIRPIEEGYKYSRAVEYQMDYETMTATLIWEFDTHSYTNFKGSARRMKNGNTIVYCPACSKQSSSTWEVNPQETVVSNITWPVKDNSVWYAFRVYPLETLNGEVIISSQESYQENYNSISETLKKFLHNII